jgi:hypothetical protein
LNGLVYMSVTEKLGQLSHGDMGHIVGGSRQLLKVDI